MSMHAWRASTTLASYETFNYFVQFEGVNMLSEVESDF